jgi:hypothetical protein
VHVHKTSEPVQSNAYKLKIHNNKLISRPMITIITILQEGPISRVGDENSIKIWGDRWIPAPTSYSIQSPVRLLDSEAKVSALVDASMMWWNISLIKRIFNEEEATKICSMAICPQRQQDKLVWVGTKNGIFSIKSAYHLAREKNDCIIYG